VPVSAEKLVGMIVDRELALTQARLAS
jgi:hypothetical protein